MSRLRLLLVLAGAGTLLAGLPASAAGPPAALHPAAVRPHADPAPGSATGQTHALTLLSAASTAARIRSYSGTQYVSTWHEDSASSSVADIRHAAAGGSVVAVRPTAGPEADAAVTPTPDLDPRLLSLLAKHYILGAASDTTCAGRAAHVVEVRRPGGNVAGRFWVDTSTALLLRRETFDSAGRLVRSSAFSSLTVGPTSTETSTASPAAPAAALDSSTVDSLRRDGWQIPAMLAGDLELYDARMRTLEGKPVLHLSYSDGLSTLSLFAQRGSLGAGRMAGFRKQKLGHDAVWVRSSSPERVVWAGGGRVFTLLSDAPPDAVRAAVTGLPHEKAHHTGLLARLIRGLARVGSWLNPFS
ncbi:MAG: hypothetical protein NVSMB55_10170 [Mycobacteriales bacterium]